MESQLLLVILPFDVFVFLRLKQCFCILVGEDASPLLMLPLYCVHELEKWYRSVLRYIRLQ